MSIENAEKLLNDSKMNSALALFMREAVAKAFYTAAKEKGYNCTFDEYKKAIAKEMDHGELSEEELSKITGGFGYLCG